MKPDVKPPRVLDAIVDRVLAYRPKREKREKRERREKPPPEKEKRTTGRDP